MVQTTARMLPTSTRHRPPSPARPRVVVVALALLLAAASPTKVPGQDAERWRSALEFGFTGASGNSSFSILSASGSVTRLQQDRFELDLSTRLRWGRSDGEVIADDVQGTLKFDWTPDAVFSPFLFATASRDVIRNLDLRLLGGGGVKWTFLEPSEETKMSLSLAAVLDHENYDLPVGAPGPEVVSVGRWSWRAKFDHEFGSGAAFQHVTFWLPRLSDWNDYLVDVSNSLSTRVLSNLSVVISHSYVHEEIPPPGAVRDDQRLSVVLRVSL